MLYKTGTLVHTRGRDWVVLPSERDDLLRLKPLDGREEDVRGIFLPLSKDGEIRPSQFGPPTADDLGSARAARLLFDASRLSLRSAAGPFRCAAKLGFRPRSYQMVPLVMALKQREGIRLLLADDVGVGKTVEALLIARELLERREIRRFAVVCPRHPDRGGARQRHYESDAGPRSHGGRRRDGGFQWGPGIVGAARRGRWG